MTRFLLPVFCLSLLLSACSSSRPKADVQYVDPTAVETVSLEFGSTDLQLIADKMVGSLLSFPPIVALTQQERPVLFVDKIQNQTDQHINMQDIGEMVLTRLTQSGKFRFVDPALIKAVRAQLDYQHDSGLVKPDTAVKAGKQIGAEYMLYGSLSNITKRNADQTDVYFLMTLKLLNLKTGMIEWAEQKQLKKVRKRALLGL